MVHNTYVCDLIFEKKVNYNCLEIIITFGTSNSIYLENEQICLLAFLCNLWLFKVICVSTVH